MRVISNQDSKLVSGAVSVYKHGHIHHVKISENESYKLVTSDSITLYFNGHDSVMIQNKNIDSDFHTINQENYMNYGLEAFDVIEHLGDTWVYRFGFA